MNRLLTSIVAVLIASLAIADQPPVATAPAHPLLGRWQIVWMGRKKLPDDVKLFWTFDQHNVVITDGNGEVISESQYSLRKDRAHDFVSLSQDGKKEPNFVGWYERMDGTLRIQMASDGGNPSELWNEDAAMTFRLAMAK